MADIIRVGFISSVDAGTGTARVYYPDRESTTAPLQLFSFQTEYRLPEIGDQVVVAHLSNDTSSGIILGKFWSEADPPASGLDYYKQFGGESCGTLQNGRFTLQSEEIELRSSNGSITLSELISLRERVRALEEAEK